MVTDAKLRMDCCKTNDKTQKRPCKDFKIPWFKPFLIRLINTFSFFYYMIISFVMLKQKNQDYQKNKLNLLKVMGYGIIRKLCI